MFNTWNWSKLTEDTYGYRSKIFSWGDFSLYYSHAKNVLGEYFVAPSFGDFVNASIHEIKLIDRWIAHCQEIPAKVKICSSDPVESGYFNVQKDGYIHQIDFSSYDHWYNDIVTYRFKRNIKLARKKDLSVKIETDEHAVRSFWGMHARLRLEKFNEIPQPWAYFKNIHERYFKSDLGFILNAYDAHGTLTGGILVIIDKDVAYYKFGASVAAYLHARPNNFLIDRLIYYLNEVSIHKLNLGYTGISSEYDGLRAFKLSAGAKEIDRYVLKTPSYQQLDGSHIGRINRDITSLKISKPQLEDVDNFSMKYYRVFI